MTEKKLELWVEESAELSSSPGDFGGKVQDGKLLLPQNVYKLFDDLRATHDAGSLIATYQHFPSYKKVLAEHLGWKEEEVQKAYENLVDLVRDHVPERYLNWSPPKRAYGAMPPDPSYIGKTPRQLKNKKKN